MDDGLASLLGTLAPCVGSVGVQQRERVMREARVGMSYWLVLVGTIASFARAQIPTPGFTVQGEVKDVNTLVDPLTTQRLAPKSIRGYTEQPSAPYKTDGAEADNKMNIGQAQGSGFGTLSDPGDLYEMSSDPDHEPKPLNKVKWQDYYKEEKLPAPPPLPEGQKNPFEVKGNPEVADGESVNKVDLLSSGGGKKPRSNMMNKK